MTATGGKMNYFICGKEKSTFKCQGCSEDFCYIHLTEHRETLAKRYDQIENGINQSRQIFIEQKGNPQSHPLTEEINKWEYDSIELIKQTANRCRQRLIEHTNKYINELEQKLVNLTDQIRKIRQENDLNEIDLNQLQIKLTQITEQLTQPSNISIRRDFIPFINKISVVASALGYKHQLKWMNGTIALKSMINGKFVTAEHFGSRSLIACSSKLNEWGKFRIITVNQELNHVALNAVVNNLYVTAENGGAKPLIANRPHIDIWEIFEVVELTDNIVALKSLANNQFVCADHFGHHPLIANRNVASTWESFEVIPQY